MGVFRVQTHSDRLYAILGAVAVIIHEERDAQRKINDELRTRCSALEAKIDALEQQRGSPRSLRAPPEKSALIA